MVKRKHRHILEVARAIRFQGALPIRFWGAVYYRMPTEVLKGQSPYEVFHKAKPQHEHLRTIGCMCYATNLVKHDKLSSRADACVMIGYPANQKRYILYNLRHKKFTVSRDVIFKKCIFPFKDLKTTHEPFFMD